MFRTILAYLGLLRDKRGRRLSVACLRARRRNLALAQPAKSRKVRIRRAWAERMKDPDFAAAARARAAKASEARVSKMNGHGSIQPVE